MELAVVGSTKTLSVSDDVFGREFSEDLCIKWSLLIATLAAQAPRLS